MYAHHFAKKTTQHQGGCSCVLACLHVPLPHRMYSIFPSSSFFSSSSVSCSVSGMNILLFLCGKREQHVENEALSLSLSAWTVWIRNLKGERKSQIGPSEQACCQNITCLSSLAIRRARRRRRSLVVLRGRKMKLHFVPKPRFSMKNCRWS